MKKIIIAGGSGFIGKKLIKFLINKNFEIELISRKSGSLNIPEFNQNIPIHSWNDDLISILENSNSVINLTGASIGAKRWTESYKKEILLSRTESASKLIKNINLCKNPPIIYIQASAVGYYGDRKDEILTEESQSGHDFLAEVCKQVEFSTEGLKAPTRRIIARLGVVLDKSEGALQRMQLPFRFYAGGRLGTGRQWLSWIHIDDLVSSFYWIINNQNSNGIYNIVSPNPVCNYEFNKILANTIRKPYWLATPEFILNLILGELSELILNSQRVIPQRLINQKFSWKYELLKTALENLK